MESSWEELLVTDHNSASHFPQLDLYLTRFGYYKELEDFKSRHIDLVLHLVGWGIHYNLSVIEF